MRKAKAILMFLASIAVAFCQSSTLSSQVATQQFAIQAAVDKGDLMNALDLTTALRALLKGAMINNGSSPVEILAKSEELMTYTAPKDPDTAVGRLLFLPRNAWNAGAYGKVQSSADQLLAAGQARGVSADTHSDAVFEAETFKGLIAVRNGDMNAAALSLVGSSTALTPNSIIGKTGCRFDLASVLLNAGQRDAVTQFLAKCQSVRPTEKDKYEVWIVAIKGGATPVLTRLSMCP